MLYVNVALHPLPAEVRRIRETLTKEIPDFHHLVCCQVADVLADVGKGRALRAVRCFFLVKEMRFWREKRSLMVDLFACGCSRNGGRMDEAETGRSSDGEKKAGFSDGHLYCGTLTRDGGM